ncbi:Ephrin type-B receptor 3 [Portunus trituberculatus]|uniref:Ephrin type-B receptor 3 n=1 Tax=Portunus trituberculatus TaxID=210409 RepID=A0A5B7FJ21_PORTR|nr:Ephrin type-B receptor 3 [Portunus trituberculatus]
MTCGRDRLRKRKGDVEWEVYYITCPEITKAFTHFPTTPTGAEVTSIEQATGTCVAHAREESPPSFLCTGDGQWSLLNGGCACLPGYQADTEKQTCDGVRERERMKEVCEERAWPSGADYHNNSWCPALPCPASGRDLGYAASLTLRLLPRPLRWASYAHVICASEAEATQNKQTTRPQTRMRQRPRRFSPRPPLCLGRLLVARPAGGHARGPVRRSLMTGVACQRGTLGQRVAGQARCGGAVVQRCR